jgi:hypothetical protein
MLAFGMVGLAATAAEAQKGKPAPQPTVVNWRCDVDIRDASGDAIKSDGGGSYVDGVDGLLCSMSPLASAQAGNPAAGSATFYFDDRSRSPRTFMIAARPGVWSETASRGLQIRVFNLVDMPLNAPQTRAMAIPTSAIGAMYADDLGAGDLTTDLVTVVRTDECTWQVSFDAPNAAVQRYASLDRKRLIDTPQLPLGFTLTTRAPDGSTISPCPVP